MSRLPHGELGSVDKASFLCCSGVSSSIFEGHCICPGFGCNNALLVNDGIDELRARMKARGDSRQLQSEGHNMLAAVDVPFSVASMNR
jgi:hypothetical protein